MEFILAFALAVLISFLMTIPAGPLLMLCMQRTLTRGLRSAYTTALGAATSDAVYAIIAAVSVLAAHSYLGQKHPMLAIAGGSVLVAFGLFTIGVNPPEVHPDLHNDRGNFATGFFLALANPGTLAGFAAVFAVFRRVHPQLLHPLTLILGMITGSFICLAGVSFIIHKIRHLLSERTLRILNGIAGMSIIITGIFFIFRAL